MIKYFWGQITFWLNIWRNRYQSKPHRLKYILKTIRKQELKPGDFVILRHHKAISQKGLIRLKKQFEKLFQSGIVVIVLEESLDMSYLGALFCPICGHIMTKAELNKYIDGLIKSKEMVY